ncbi:hypothetical protein AB6A40_009983 [Gnathostoma spinigerum]|uniref:15-oxoprostaglandin 13-reductase n=1 Tax=Gnathostoma spinigerum TaxID=75299 RepID=A0ABD6EYQ5_9BILA
MNGHYQAQQSCSTCGAAADYDSHLAYNKRVIFVKRPGPNNAPTADCFQCEDCPAPYQSDLGDGQCIVRTLYLSVDPSQRCRMNRSTGVDYLEPFKPGGLVDGLEGIGIVEMVSLRCDLSVGDLVTSFGHLWPWSRLFVADQADLVKVRFMPFICMDHFNRLHVN